MSKETMKLALEALNAATRYGAGGFEDAKDALRAALAKPDFWEGYVLEPVKPSPVPWSQALEDVWAEEPAQQEPVGKVTETIDGAFKCEFSKPLQKGALLYTTPPAQQEPVACIYKGYLYMAHEFQSGQCPIDSQPLYTSPPAQRTWVNLTPQNLNEIFKVANTGEGAVHLALKLIKEKNT